MNKSLISLALLGTILLSASTYLFFNKNPLQSIESVDQQFRQWQKKYNKKFSDPAVYSYRLSVFAANLQIVEQDTTGTLGITQFFDLTTQEFEQTYLTLKVTEQAIAQNIPVNGDVNWVTAKKVTGVKDQGQCGSCWAFSATGSIESALIIQKGESQTINLSEQQLVDCSGSYGNQGCNGGWMDDAFQYVIDQGIVSNSAYPYVAVDQTCNDQATQGGVKIASFTDVATTTTDLLNALQQQPISVAVNASTWNFYKTGVFSLCQSSGLNHGVLLVGFENNAWIIKNSWGPSWGESGYIRLANGNTCGLANAPSYPTA